MAHEYRLVFLFQMKPKTLYLHLDELRARGVKYAPRGCCWTRVVYCWEEGDRPYPWENEPTYKFEKDGEYTLGQMADGNYIMQWKPHVIVDEKSRQKDIYEEINFPEENEEEIGMPKLEKTLSWDSNHEGQTYNKETGEWEGEHDGTTGYNKVQINIRYNEEDFPVNWGQIKEIREDRWIQDNNEINYYKIWRTGHLITGQLVREYYSGISLHMRFILQITKINKVPIEEFKHTITGTIMIMPGEMGVWIKRVLDTGEYAPEEHKYKYEIRGYYNSKIEGKGPVIKSAPFAWVKRSIVEWNRGIHIKLGMSGEKDVIEVTGNAVNEDQELKLDLDADKFHLDLKEPEPPEPDPEE